MFTILENLKIHIKKKTPFLHILHVSSTDKFYFLLSQHIKDNKILKSEKVHFDLA